jgi:hypothetical protein
MIAVLSPAKTLDFEREPITGKHTIPEFIDEAAGLVDRLRALGSKDIQTLMGVNEEIAELNATRFDTWTRHQSLDDGLQAIFAYAGEVYRGFDVDRLSAEDLYYAQNHLRILSGLYGTLRPLDVIQPYRLEMGTDLANDRGADLYAYWGSKIAESLSGALRGQSSHTIVNLASKEYFSAVPSSSLDASVITPQFKEKRGTDYRIIAVYAKNARGRMARYMIENRIEDPEELKKFDEDGYRYAEQLSGEGEWVFARESS